MPGTIIDAISEHRSAALAEAGRTVQVAREVYEQGRRQGRMEATADLRKQLDDALRIIAELRRLLNS